MFEADDIRGDLAAGLSLIADARGPFFGGLGV